MIYRSTFLNISLAKQQKFTFLQRLLLKIFIEHAWLHTFVALIFIAFVVDVLTLNGVIKNLANFNMRVNTHRLNARNFKRPKTFKANVAKPGGHVNKKTKTSN